MATARSRIEKLERLRKSGDGKLVVLTVNRDRDASPEFGEAEQRDALSEFDINWEASNLFLVIRQFSGPEAPGRTVSVSPLRA
jgi:hypothetical protein